QAKLGSSCIFYKGWKKLLGAWDLNPNNYFRANDTRRKRFVFLGVKFEGGGTLFSDEQQHIFRNLLAVNNNIWLESDEQQYTIKHYDHKLKVEEYHQYISVCTCFLGLKFSLDKHTTPLTPKNQFEITFLSLASIIRIHYNMHAQAILFRIIVAVLWCHILIQ
ncbi:hypothetical protein ACJX0J_020679, partial [Zea mays]